MATRDPDRREKIIEASRRLFAKYGYEGTSISMIAAETGLTKAALYHHFASKEALFHISFRTGIDELIEEVETALSRVGNDPSERLRAFMVATACRFERNQESWAITAAIFWSTRSLMPRAELVQRRDHFENLLKSIIQAGIDNGSFRDDLDVSLTGKFLMSVINQMPRWYRKGGKYQAVEIVSMYLDTFIPGMRTETMRA